MDITQILQWIFLCLGAFLISLLIDYFIKKRDYWKKFLRIPGPAPLPFIGNILELRNYMTKEKVFKLLRDMNENYGNIWRLQILYGCGVSLSHPDDLELILSSSKHIDKSELYLLLDRWLGTGLLTSTGEHWFNRRKILTPAFHFNILKQFLPTVVEHTNSLIEKLCHESQNHSTNITSFITETTLHTICETAMGSKLDTKNKEQNNYVQAIHKFVDVIINRLFSPWMHYQFFYYNILPTGIREKKLVNLMQNFTRNIIKKRQINFVPTQQVNDEDDVYKSKKKLAMLDLLLTAKMEGADINDEGIREEVDTFMFEGHDTTAACLCFTLMLIANHKDVQEKLLQEIEEVLGQDKWPPTYQELQELQYMERCIKESLRLYPSVPYFGRQLKEEVTTKSGYVLPANLVLHLEIFDLHRNPDIYPDPEKYDPDRFLPEVSKTRHPFAYLPFSAGPRNCIGQRFAMLEMKTILIAILRKFQLKPIDTPHTISLTHDLILRTTRGIKVQFRLRN